MSTYTERRQQRQAEYRRTAEFYERWFARARTSERQAMFRAMADFWWRKATR